VQKSPFAYTLQPIKTSTFVFL